MSFLPEVQLDKSFGPFIAFQENFGFIPNLFRAQTLLPRVIEAQARLEGTLLMKEGALSRVQKEQILLTVAASLQNTHCVTAHLMILRSLAECEDQLVGLLNDYRRAGLPAAEVAVLDFALKLIHYAHLMNSEDIDALRRWGFEDESILEAVLVTALSCYLCTLSMGLGPEPDFEPPKLPLASIPLPQGTGFESLVPHDAHASSRKGPYLRTVYQSPKTFAPFAFLQKSHGFIPNFFRAQTLRPDVIEAEADAVSLILLPEDVLNRVQKECILLAVSAANLNSYCVAVHCNVLRGLGMSGEDGDQIAVDHHLSDISEADKALLDFALKLGTRSREFGCEDVDRIRLRGFTDEQILECVAVTALNNFSNTLQMGLGVPLDFEPRHVFGPKKMHLSPPGTRPTIESSLLSPQGNAGEDEDADAGVVARVQGGDLEAFEELVRRHSRRVYRTVVGIMGDPEEARDATQDVFLKGFEHISEFQGRSKFSTWLLSIARNAALQLLRERTSNDSLDEDGPVEEGEFRPRQIHAWHDNPERLYAEAEIRGLVETAVLRLPAKYRVVVMLRDIEQLPTEEVAETLGLSVPALKARLLRGRLMLRESLSPHFTESVRRTSL
jgi:RNA polymerase sigma-70 factor (ECF subfamily)